MEQTPSMEREVPVNLRDQELLERGQHLAEMVAERTSLVEAKKAENKRRQDDIDKLDEEIAQVAAALLNGHENRKQGDLFFDQTLPKDQAAKRLAEIARMAERHPFVTSDVIAVGGGQPCAREGCGAEASAEVHVPPAAAERHTYVPDGTGEGKCWTACGEPKEAWVHQVEPAPSPVEETFVCADCEASGASLEACTHPKSEGMWIGADGRKVCANCRQAAIEAGTWPHEFSAEAIHKRKRGEPKKCRHCEKPQDDPVHAAAAPSPATTEDTPPLPADTDTKPGEVPPDESVAIAKERVTGGGDPAYDFPDDEPAPNVIRSHAAIER